MPYILTSMLMVMMFYMFDALTKSKDLRMETLPAVRNRRDGYFFCDFSLLYKQFPDETTKN